MEPYFSNLSDHSAEELKEENSSSYASHFLGVERVFGEGQVKEEVKCRICMGILREPRECKVCENCFCADCLRKWLEVTNMCPLKCSNEPKFRDRPHKIVRNMLSELKLTCKNSLNGCSQILPYDSLSSHEQSCAHQHLECSGAINGCTQVLARPELLLHESTCEFVPVPCDYCKKQVRRSGIKDHWKHCEDVELSCEFCKGVFRKKNYFIHVNVQCEEYIMNCGRCQGSYKRKYKEFHDCVRHLQNCQKTMNEEVVLLKREIGDRDKKIQNMEMNFNHRMDKVMEVVSNLQEQLAALQKESRSEKK